jgi:hypothetical protein
MTGHGKIKTMNSYQDILNKSIRLTKDNIVIWKKIKHDNGVINWHGHLDITRLKRIKMIITIKGNNYISVMYTFQNGKNGTQKEIIEIFPNNILHFIKHNVIRYKVNNLIRQIEKQHKRLNNIF